MKKFVKLFCIAFCMCNQILEAQKTFNVDLEIGTAIDKQKLSFSYDDGQNSSIPITETFKNDKININRKFYSFFAVLHMNYKENDSVSYESAFFVNDKPAVIKLFKDTVSVISNPFQNCKTINATDIYSSETQNRLSEFSKKEISAMNHFWAKNSATFQQNDSINKLFKATLQKVNERNLEFIKQNANEYFSFWYFRTQIISVTAVYNKSGDLREYKKLLSFFRTVFPLSYKRSYEGRSIETLLKGKMNTETGRINTQINNPAPEFDVKDIKGRFIRLRNFRGKYVLLDFWATWCGPCMQEISFIKNIRETYRENKLIMISVSIDNAKDQIKAKNIIREKMMNWINLFGKNDLNKTFGVSAIPAIFLINKEGIIIYKSEGIDHDALTALLKKM
jgi:thiol-disulfide isomerase/thioredoxin